MHQSVTIKYTGTWKSLRSIPSDDKIKVKRLLDLTHYDQLDRLKLTLFLTCPSTLRQQLSFGATAHTRRRFTALGPRWPAGVSFLHGRFFGWLASPCSAATDASAGSWVVGTGTRDLKVDAAAFTPAEEPAGSTAAALGFMSFLN